MFFLSRLCFARFFAAVVALLRSSSVAPLPRFFLRLLTSPPSSFPSFLSIPPPKQSQLHSDISASGNRGGVAGPLRVPQSANASANYNGGGGEQQRRQRRRRGRCCRFGARQLFELFFVFLFFFII